MANQIDFAMAVGVIVVVIAFAMFYATSYFSRASAGDKTSELQAVSSGLEKILFGSSGIPANWENNNYVPVRAGLGGNAQRIAIAAAEKGGANHTFEEADLHIVFDPKCVNTAYNNSIRLYDRFLNETPFRIYNSTECAANSGFLREANINFLFNITGNTSTVFWLYYTNDTATPKKSAYNFSYDPSLVGYWKLDSVNASNYTLDSTANRNDGKLYNGSTSCFNLTGCINLTAGQIGNALQFDGVDDYVDAGNGTSLNITDAITVEAWVKIPDTSAVRYLIKKGRDLNAPDASAGFVIGMAGGSNNLLYFQIGNGTVSNGDYTLDIQNNYNQWIHIVAVRDISAGKLYWYKNGAVSGSDTDLSGSISNSAILYIGGSGTGEFFNGTIDEVRIYNRSLSAEEIKAHYNYTSPNYVASSGSIPIITHKKISAFQNLSYADARSTLDMKRNFNITACEYSLGRHIPDTVNVIASSYPIMLVNRTGSVKSCMAAVNVW